MQPAQPSRRTRSGAAARPLPRALRRSGSEYEREMRWQLLFQWNETRKFECNAAAQAEWGHEQGQLHTQGFSHRNAVLHRAGWTGLSAVLEERYGSGGDRGPQG